MSRPRLYSAAAGRQTGARIVERRIVGFHRDEVGDWVAELECGHTQHTRHDPPWQLRPWVLTEEGRAARIGQPLQCRACDEPA